MKTRFLLLVTCLSITAGIYAQKGVDTGTQYGSGDDSVRCVRNVSLFMTAAQANNFQEAYPYWKIVYAECPAAHIGIYQNGVKIYDWLIDNESDPAKKDVLINELIEIYDKRVKYFGNHAQYQQYKKDWIVRTKAQHYYRLKGESSNHSMVYQWLSEVVDEFQEKAESAAISYFMFSSLQLMKLDANKHKEQYINDFTKSMGLLETKNAAAVAANNTREIENIAAATSEIEQTFASSGAADCGILQDFYAAKVEENKTNLDFLKMVSTLFRRVGCSESDLFLTISEYTYKIEPTAESAMGLGLKAIKNNDYTTGEKYFNEAIAMSTNSETNAALYVSLARLALSRGQYQKAVQEAKKSLAEKPTGQAYLLIGSAYASSASSIFPDDAVLMKCVYIAAVDKLERARQLDQTLASEANRLIASYRQYFPTAEQIFMHPSLSSGANFTIPGWINETVKIP